MVVWGVQADGRMMSPDAFEHLSFDSYAEMERAERLESLRSQHQLEEGRTGRREWEYDQPPAARPKATRGGNTRLFVTNLPHTVDWQALMRHFEHIGAVAFCDVYTHRKGTPAVIANPDLEGKSKVRVCVYVYVYVCVCVCVYVYVYVCMCVCWVSW